MEKIFRNPGFHYLAVQVLDHLDSKNLMNFRLVSKVCNQFVTANFHHEIWIRKLNELRKRIPNTKLLEKENVQAMISYYIETSEITGLKNLALFIEKYFYQIELSFRIALNLAMRTENETIMESVLNSPMLDFIPEILHSACRLRKPKLVKAVLSKIDTRTLNSMNYQFDTPLMIACSNGDFETVQLLLQRDDLDVDLQCKGLSPLLKAHIGGHIGIENLLLQRVNSK